MNFTSNDTQRLTLNKRRMNGQMKGKVIELEAGDRYPVDRRSWVTMTTPKPVLAAEKLKIFTVSQSSNLVRPVARGFPSAYSKLAGNPSLRSIRRPRSMRRELRRGEAVDHVDRSKTANSIRKLHKEGGGKWKPVKLTAALKRLSQRCCRINRQIRLSYSWFSPRFFSFCRALELQ